MTSHAISPAVPQAVICSASKGKAYEAKLSAPIRQAHVGGILITHLIAWIRATVRNLETCRSAESDLPLFSALLQA